MGKHVKAGWGNIPFYQLEKGYRFSIDSVLLAAFIRVKRGYNILEAGSGEGIIPLLLSIKTRDFTYTGIEIQEELCNLANENLRINEIDGRVICGDWNDLRSVENERYDIGILNPPYYRIGTGRRNPDRIEEIARHETKGNIDSGLRFLKRGVKKKGKIYIVFPATRLETLIISLNRHSISPKTILPVYSHRESVAKFLLCEGVKEGGEETTLLPPLYIFEDPERKIYTAEMERIMKTLIMEEIKR